MRNNTETSDALFESVFEAAAVGLALLDTNGRFLRTNTAFQAMFGYSEAELQSVTFADLAHPEDVDGHVEPFAELMAGTRQSFELFKRYMHRHGTIVLARVTVSRVPDGHVLGVVKDVTADWDAREERDRLLYRLRERVKELTTLHEASRLTDRPDLQTPDLIEHIAALLPPAVQHTTVAAARVSYGSFVSETQDYRPTPWRLTAPFVTADGTPGAVEVAYLVERPPEEEGPFLAEERALLSTLAEMLRRRLDRRLADDEVRHAQERLRAAMSAVDMAFWEWDILNDRVTWSPEMARLAGVPAQPLIGRFGERANLVHRDDAAAVAQGLQQAVADPAISTHDVEFRLGVPDGEPRWVFGRAHIFRDEAGRAQRVLGALIDVTRRRVLQEQFLQAQKMEALGRFAGGIAHDFNNVLAVVLGECDLINMSTMSPSDLHASIEHITEAATRASALMQQLLTFSRTGELNPLVLDVNDALARMDGFIRRLAGHHRVTLALAREVDCIQIDPGQFDQAIMNLVVNARDAMTSDGTITISTGRSNDGRVTVAVTDTGSGMDKATRERIFEPFFTTKAPGKGTGLGLTVVRSVVNHAKGEIVVDSTPGRGTTVELRFPRETVLSS